MREITEKLTNVDIRCNSRVTGYDIEPKTNIVTAVRVGALKENSIKCDQVVLCPGPESM